MAEPDLRSTTDPSVCSPSWATTWGRNALTMTARYYLATYRDWTNLALGAARCYEQLLADYRRRAR